MRNKIISVAEAVDMIPDGATIMYGGFLGCGSAHHIIEALAQKGTKDLTIIGNDCGMATGPNGEEFYGVAKLVHNHQVKHVIATHVGMTPDVGTQGMVDKTLTVDLIPQGTLAEMIRAGGAGLGLHLDDIDGGAEDVLAALGGPLVHIVGHGAGRSDGVDAGYLGEGVGHVRCRRVAVHGFQLSRHRNDSSLFMVPGQWESVPVHPPD